MFRSYLVKDKHHNCCYLSSRTWLNGNRSCYTSAYIYVYQSLTLSFINSIKGLRLGHLYAHFLIPYRSLKRQTGLTKQVFQHHMLDKLRQSRDCDHRCQSINFKPKGSEDIIGWT